MVWIFPFINHRFIQHGNVQLKFRIRVLNKFIRGFYMNNIYGRVISPKVELLKKLIMIKKLYNMFWILMIYNRFDHFVNFGNREFSSFSKKVTSRSVSDVNSILINSISIDHIQNHFLPGNTGITYDMYYYLTPSTTDPMNTTITQIACVDYRFVFIFKFFF
jgi:hypothetical protein